MNERLNIRRIETAGKERIDTFDSRKDLTPKDWARMDEVMKALYFPDSPGACLEHLPQMKILDPERALPILPHQLNEMREWVGNREDYGFVVDDANLRIIDPRLSMSMNTHRLDIEAIYREVSDVEYSIARFLAGVHILDPKINLSFAADGIERLAAEIDHLCTTANWKPFIKFRAMARVAGIDSTMRPIAGDEWGSLRSYLKELQQEARSSDGDVTDLIEVASSMKIMAASSVDITEKDLCWDSPLKLLRRKTLGDSHPRHLKYDRTT
jgi:hypothetical protein